MSSKFHVYVGPYIQAKESIIEHIDDYPDFWACQFAEGTPDGYVVVLPNTDSVLNRQSTFSSDDEAKIVEIEWSQYEEWNRFLEAARDLTRFMDRENIGWDCKIGIVPYWM